MKMLGMIDELFRAMEWSDARMWTALHDTPAAADDQRVRELTDHLHMVQQAFLSVWKSRRYEKAPSPRSFYEEARAFIASLDDAALDREVKLPWADRIAQVAGGPAQPTTLAETLMQVAMHTAHHRAQVSARIRELGGQPPLVDFIAWIWLGKPAPQWP